MISWLSANLATIIVAAIVFGILAAVIVKMVRDRKNGKSSCGCGCSGCPRSGTCSSASSDR